MSKLTDQQRTFVFQLLGDAEFNPTEAARKAKYAQPSTAAYKLLAKKEIQAVLGKKMKEREDRLEITADRVLKELACIAFRDPIELCDENGRISLDDLRKIPEHTRRAIESIKQKTRTLYSEHEESGQEVEVEMKFAAKLGALELLMKHLGMFAAEKKDISMSLDWDALLGTGKEGPETDADDDPIESRIIEAESKRLG